MPSAQSFENMNNCVPLSELVEQVETSRQSNGRPIGDLKFDLDSDSNGRNVLSRKDYSAQNRYHNEIAAEG